jgi:hypothetical protein
VLHRLAEPQVRGQRDRGDQLRQPHVRSGKRGHGYHALPARTVSSELPDPWPRWSSSTCSWALRRIRWLACQRRRLAWVARPTLRPIDRMPPLELRTRHRLFGVAGATTDLRGKASRGRTAEQRARARESSTGLKARLDGAAYRSLHPITPPAARPSRVPASCAPPAPSPSLSLLGAQASVSGDHFGALPTDDRRASRTSIARDRIEACCWNSPRR